MVKFEKHPDWNQLAALADCGPDGASRDLLEHIAACPECASAWAAAVEARHLELANANVKLDRVEHGIGRRQFRIHRHFSWGLGGLAAAAILLVIVLPRLGDHAGFSRDEGVVMQQLSELSHIGLVYPGVEHLGASSRTDYRTGGQANHEIDHFLWSDRFADDPTDTTAAFWLAASHLSVGRLDHADDILRQALRLTPAARELRHLMAIVAYRRNDLVLASRELDLLLGTHPDDALATLNRAVLEVEAGRGLAVCSVLERIARSAENAAIRHRAAQLIRDAGCR